MARQQSKMPAGIIKRGPAQYLARTRRKGIKLAKTFETLDEAADWLGQMKRDIKAEKLVDDRRERETTLGQVIEAYRQQVTPTKKGRKQEEVRLAAWLREPIALLPIASIESRHIVEWRDLRIKEGKAPSTINNAMNLLSSVFKIARGEISYKVDNPCTHVRRAKGRPPRDVSMSPENEAILLDACREVGPYWLVWIVRLAIETAMRQGELRRLRWQHIHPTHIHLQAGETKNDQARDVPLTSSAARLVSDMRVALYRRGSNSGWVFGDPDLSAEEGGFTMWMVQFAYRAAVALAIKNGMAIKPTFHDLRHVAATRLRLVHQDAMDLSKTTGHKTISQLARYDNPTPEARAAAIRAREKALLAG